jgi:two-component system, cell cycle sensor histidine kinase and response regulator CckA
VWYDERNHTIMADTNGDDIKDKLAQLDRRIQELTALQPMMALEDRPFEFADSEQRQDLIETILANLPVGVAILETDTGKIIYMNRELESIYGWTRDELPTAAVVFERTIPDLKARYELFERIVNALSCGDPERLRWDDVTIVTGDNQDRAVTAKNFLLPDRNLTVTVVIDVTRRKEIEDALAASERRYREMVDTVPFAVLTLDSSMKVSAWNSSAERIFGWTRHEAIGRAPYEFMMPPQSRMETTILLASILQAGSGGEGINQNLRKDGSLITCRWNNKVLKDSAGGTAAILSTAEDITHQIQLEEQFRQAQKMEAVGRLAGGVAHDFNNLLTAILGYSEMLLLEEDLSHAAAECVDGITQSAHRAAAMTRQLLSFSRPQTVELRQVDVNRLLAGTTSMFERLIGENIALDLKLSQESCGVRINAGQLEQVIMNLVVNARDAMPRGGRLTIGTYREHLEDTNYPAGGEPRAGWYVTVVVQDTGVGMDEETMAHLFEPFFTTKGPDEGTGLGLSTAYGIVTQSGGRISVVSAPGEGTTFTIHLPMDDHDLAPQTATPDDTQLKQGTETILLVEDEASLIKMFQRILSRLNYRVVEARNGVEALKVVDSGEALDLLVTDVMMPEMGGKDLSARVLQKRPGIKVLFISGYADDEVFPEAIPEADRHLLVKPFTAAQFAAKIREVLES